LTWRLPPQLRRTLVVLPELAGWGAVPFHARVGALRAEASGAGRFADDLGGGECAAGDREERRGERGDERLDLAFEFVDAAVELADALEQLARDGRDEPIDRGGPGVDALDDVLDLEAAGGDVEVGRDLVQMPADPALNAGSLGDEVVAVIDQQP
jgi:hypothetical protein